MYFLTMNYPIEDVIEDDIQKYLKKKEAKETSLDDIIEIYNKCVSSGYAVSIKYITPEIDMFELATKLTEMGIDYKASLKIKKKMTYKEMQFVANCVENSGFNYDVTIKLKVNENSFAEINDNNSWLGDDVVYTISPKINVTDINEIKSLYEKLIDYDLVITVNPKYKQGVIPFYPEGTEIIMNLKDDLSY